MRYAVLSGVLAAILLGGGAGAEEDPAPPVEFGRVAWLRDLEAGLEQARAANRSVLLLFQEVPG